MTVIQRLPGDFNITDPDWPRYSIWTPGTVFTSDDFSDPGEPVGRMTNAALGGIPARWVGTEGSLIVQDGEIYTPEWGASGPAAVEVPADKFDVSFTVTKLPTNGFLYVFALRDHLAGGGYQQLMFRLNTLGSVVMRDERGGDSTMLGTVSDVAPGDSFTIHVDGTKVAVDRNGVTETTGEAATPYPGKYAGVLKSGSSYGGAVDDFVITAQ